MKTIEDIKSKLRKTCAHSVDAPSKDIGGGMRTELCEFLSINQILATRAPVFSSGILALLTRGGPEAQDFEDKWVIKPLTREYIRERALTLLNAGVNQCINHKPIQVFDTLSRIEILLWIIDDEETSLYEELAGDRPSMRMMGAPYINAAAMHFDLSLSESAQTDVFRAMVRGEICPWCENGENYGCH